MANREIDPISCLNLFGQNGVSWLFHYPVYLNTYCLAHHLEHTLLDLNVDEPKANLVRRHLRRHDWAKETLPNFVHDVDYELFVATNEMLQQLGAVTNCYVQEVITKYHIGSIFIHRKNFEEATHRQTDPNDLAQLGKALKAASLPELAIITDIPETAKKIRESLSESLDSQASMDIRKYWEREIADFSDCTAKIYIFSAPVVEALRKRNGLDDQPTKYIEVKVGEEIQPVDTYLVVKYAADACEKKAKQLLESVSQYYELLFHFAKNTDEKSILPPWWKGISHRYGRIAESSGQPNPFTALLESALDHDERTAKADLRYLSILGDHNWTG